MQIKELALLCIDFGVSFLFISYKWDKEHSIISKELENHSTH